MRRRRRAKKRGGRKRRKKREKRKKREYSELLSKGERGLRSRSHVNPRELQPPKGIMECGLGRISSFPEVGENFDGEREGG